MDDDEEQGLRKWTRLSAQFQIVVYRICFWPWQMRRTVIKVRDGLASVEHLPSSFD